MLLLPSSKPFTPKFKEYILTTNWREKYITDKWELVVSFILVSYEKPSSPYCVMYNIYGEAEGEIWN